METKSIDIEKIFIKNTSMEEEEVRTVLQQIHNSGKTLKEYFSEKNYKSVDDLMKDFCVNMDLEFLEQIPIHQVSPDLIQNLPINYAKNHSLLPLNEAEGFVRVVTSNPLKVQNLNDLCILFEKKVRPLFCTYAKIQDAINKAYEKNPVHLEGLDDIEGEDYDLDENIVDLLEMEDSDAPVIKLVNSLFFRAVKEKASDIHFEPYEKSMVVRFRVDGALVDIFKPPKKLQNAITSRVKVIGNLDIAEKRLPQDGRFPLNMGGKRIDVRLNTVPTVFGERMVMRLQDRSKVALELSQLGFSESNLTKIYDLIQRSYGIVLVTGPTGSGKSTTLYAALCKINDPEKNIITVEEPVEQQIHGIGQIQVNSKIGLTFGAGLRAILRQDPNVIMIGEIRDLETAEIAINASLTGHLVFSTLHTNDASGSFPRLIDMGCEPFLIATSLLGIIAQRLIRILCPHCKEKYDPTEVELKSLEMNPERAGEGNICRAKGCEECNHKGYLGQTLIQELLIINDSIRSLIMQKKDSSVIRKQAIQNGMATLREHGVEKILKGLTTIEEILGNTQLDT